MSIDNLFTQALQSPRSRSAKLLYVWGLTCIAYSPLISIAHAQLRRSAREPLPEAAGPEVLFWIIVTTLGFALGAINGLLILSLRRLRHQYAGTRWTFGFWAGVAWAPITLIIARALTSWAVELTSPSALVLITLMNVSGVWWIAKWAAYEERG